MSLEISELMSIAGRDAAQSERAGSLTAGVVAAIRDSGMLRHFVPASWGGAQGSFSDYFEAIAELGEADTSTAWCAAIAASASRMAAFLPEEGRRAVWGDTPDAFLACTLLPGGLATPVADGWSVAGDWPYVSGVRHAEWALLCCRVADAGPGDSARFMLIPRDAFTVEETWDNAGMRATGSETLAIRPTFVPAGHSFALRDLFAGAACPPEPCFAVPHEAVSGIAFVAPLIGAARGALGIWSGQLLGDGTRSGSVPIGAQTVFASASAKTDAAQLLVQRAARAADEHASTPVPTGRNRRDFAMAATLASRAVSEVFQAAGVRASSHGGRLQRIWRDVGSAALHPALRLEPAAAEYFTSVVAS